MDWLDMALPVTIKLISIFELMFLSKALVSHWTVVMLWSAECSLECTIDVADADLGRQDALADLGLLFAIGVTTFHSSLVIVV